MFLNLDECHLEHTHCRLEQGTKLRLEVQVCEFGKGEASVGSVWISFAPF